MVYKKGTSWGICLMLWAIRMHRLMPQNFKTLIKSKTSCLCDVLSISFIQYDKIIKSYSYTPSQALKPAKLCSCLSFAYMQGVNYDYMLEFYRCTIKKTEFFNGDS